LNAHHASPQDIESPYAWTRLLTSLALMTIGNCGMYAVSVVLPRLQADFAVTRGVASLPYTLTMIGFAIGGIMMGRIADRFGVMVSLMIGGVGLGAGFMLAGSASSMWQFNLAHGVLIGLFGTSATFAPLLADTSLWFNRRRGIAIAICASGNYLSGAVWPPIMQHFIDSAGWRDTYHGIGVFCLLSMLPLALVLKRRPPPLDTVASAHARGPGYKVDTARPLGLPPNALLALLGVAGIGCCVAMSMPQVHIIAYCGDLGYGATRGAQMLSLMLAFGIASRLLSGWISDHIGGLRTLLLGVILQGVALLLFLPFNGLVSLYVVSALFGLFQGGIVPAYALIVREHFPAQQAGSRVGVVMMATLGGMALGGWMSGAIFDLTGSYRAAFLNGIAWNLLNLAIVGTLVYRSRPRLPKRDVQGAPA
jgi:MFS family permease